MKMSCGDPISVTGSGSKTWLIPFCSFESLCSWHRSFNLKLFFLEKGEEIDWTPLYLYKYCKMICGVIFHTYFFSIYLSCQWWSRCPSHPVPINRAVKQNTKKEGRNILHIKEDFQVCRKKQAKTTSRKPLAAPWRHWGSVCQLKGENKTIKQRKMGLDLEEGWN